MTGFGNLARRGAIRAAGKYRRAFDEKIARTVARGRSRLRVTAYLFTAAFVVVSARLVDLTVLNAQPDGANIRASVSQPQSDRADLVDRNGVLLATSLSTASLYVNPREVFDVDKAVEKLTRVLPELDREGLRDKMVGDHRFAWIARNLTPRQQHAINDLGLPGLGFRQEDRRVYPLARLFAHVVGYTDIDNRGLPGIEKYFDDRLRLPVVRPAEPFSVSLDGRFQHVVHEELTTGLDEFRAKAAVGIVLDANSGELRAMVSLPDFDPNHIRPEDDHARFNRATQGVYEMGSTFKLFTAAMALDGGVVSPNGGFDASEPIHLARHTIRDYHGKARWLSVPEIVMFSSNIGAAKMAQAAGTDEQRKFLEQLGLLGRTRIELVEAARPIIPSPWREINTMTIGFGHGLAVTPLQLASAVAAIANGGIYRPPSVLPRPRQTKGVRVISSSTSSELRKLMRLTVAHGTGGGADVQGYRVGGKTGTAEKAVRGGYRRDAVISSFVAVFPIDEPRFVVLVLFDEPRGPEKTPRLSGGGWTAAPVTGNIIARLGPLAGITPRALEPVPLPASVKLDSKSQTASLSQTAVARQVSAPTTDRASDPTTGTMEELLAQILGAVH